MNVFHTLTSRLRILELMSEVKANTNLSQITAFCAPLSSKKFTHKRLNAMAYACLKTLTLSHDAIPYLIALPLR